MIFENWSVVSDCGPHTPPECRTNQIKGKVYGNPGFPEGAQVTTSNIVKVEGAQVTTRTGSVYTLCKPNPDYVKWCRENGCHVPTPENPIKVKS
jgi:hypothetical protein